MLVCMAQNSGMHASGSARGGPASTSGRSWAHACVSGAGRSCYTDPCWQSHINCLLPKRRQRAACSLRAPDIAQPASASCKLSSEFGRGTLRSEELSSKSCRQRSRARHRAACAAAGAGGRLGWAWQPQHPGPGDKGPSSRQPLLVS